MEDKSVPVFTEPVEQNWYTLFTLFFSVRHTLQKPVLPNPTERGWAQAEDLPVPPFVTLNSNPEASLAWFQVGAPLAAQRFSVNAESHISCVLGSVDALRLTLTAASNVVIFLKRLKDFMDLDGAMLCRV